jgi:hypothetical protein
MALSYKTLVIDPDVSGRNRLRSVLSALPEIGVVRCLETREHSLLELSLAVDYTLAFVSSRLGMNTALELMGMATELESNGKITFILIVDRAKISKRIVTEALMHGFSAVLPEPYSYTSFSDVLWCARKTTLNYELSQMKKRTPIFVREAVGLIDILVILKRDQIKSQFVIKRLEKVRDILSHLSQHSLETFFLVCEEILRAQEGTRNKLSSLVYRGHSNRVRENVEHELLERLESVLCKEERRLKNRY